MEFWGIEIKPGQAVKCDPGENRLLHLSQASLGETKKDKSSENVPVSVKFNDQKLVIGTLSAERCPQIQYDLVFQKEFELSHSSKSTSVYFCGYKTVAAEEDFDEFSDSDAEDDAVEIVPEANGKLEVKESAKAGKPGSGKGEASSVKATVKPTSVKPKPEEDDSEDDDSEDDDSASDDDMPDAGDDSEDDDEDDSSDEEDATPKKAETSKKRAADSAIKTPVPEKKAKLISPAGSQKTGGGKKGAVHTATPHPAKQLGKTPANDKSKKPQTPKSGGSSVSCKSCSKTFNSDHALQAHNKAKHETAK